MPQRLCTSAQSVIEVDDTLHAVEYILHLLLLGIGQSQTGYQYAPM